MKKFKGLPYRGCLRAFAYAGLPFKKAVSILKGCEFLFPPDLNPIAKDYKAFQKMAKKHNEDYVFTPKKLKDLGIEPFYSWIIALGDSTISDNAKLVNRLFDELQHPLLRRPLDILLFIGRSSEDVASAIENKSDSPVPQWSVRDVENYKKFFWDVDSLSLEDWREYGSWWPYEIPYPHRYVFLFPTASVSDLLWEAGITPEISIEDMGEIMLHECFLRFKDRTRSGEESEALQYIESFRRLMQTVKKTTQESGSVAARRKEQELAGMIDRLNVVFQDEGHSELKDRKELGANVVVSDRSSVELNKILEDD